MTAAALLLCLLSVPVAETRVIPRFDGVLFEFTSTAPLDDSVGISGMFVNVRPGMRVNVPDACTPFWVYGWETDADSCGMTIEVTDGIDSVYYAISADSLTLLLFLSAEEPVLFPELSWNGPPEEPEYYEGESATSDFAMAAVLQGGGQSPWLEDFDCIVIDPGHGGRDPGATGPEGSFEKDRTLEVALLVRDILKIRMPELRVVLTRNDDRYVSLAERTRLANAVKADLFVSIHCNAARNSAAKGFETFFLSRARTDESRAVEMLENSVIEFDDEVNRAYHLNMEDNPLAFLLADMAQNIYLEQSSALAVKVQKSLERRFPGNGSRGVKQAGFYVLRGALMPSILVELAFISNPEEERMLKSLDFRLAAAEAIVDAIFDFMGEQ